MRFPDVEAIAIAELQPVVAPIGASGKWPNPLPGSHVRAWRTGGSAVNRVLERALITVTAQAESAPAASALLGDCRHHIMNTFGSLPLVRSVEEITGPYYDPDPDTGADRYSATFQLMVRAAR